MPLAVRQGADIGNDLQPKCSVNLNEVLVGSCGQKELQNLRVDRHSALDAVSKQFRKAGSMQHTRTFRARTAW